MDLDLIAAVAGGSVLASIISGMFGMAGGMVLMGIYSAVLPVSAAMVMHGVTQFASNGFRWFLYRRHTYWQGMAAYLFGTMAAALAFWLIRFVPNRAMVYLVLGALPFVVFALPPVAKPDFTRLSGPPLAGCLVTAIQLMAGAAGPALDIFFFHTKLEKKAVVATKALTQTVAHAIKIIYFGLIMVSVEAASAGTKVPGWLYAASVIATFLGTWLGGLILERFSEEQFRRYTRTIVMVIGVYYLVRGFGLLMA